jgi:RNA polymerase sigma factor (sigma-70 family)
MATNQLRGVMRTLHRAASPPDDEALSDRQLLESYIRSREEAAFAALVRRHGPMVWGVCRRLLGIHQDAEDAFQATFLVLVRKAASVVHVANWLYGVAHQTALKARATAARRRGKEKQVLAMPEPAVEQRELWDDLQPLLDQELSRLPEKHREVIVVCELQGKTLKEAAQQCRLPQGTVASRLARARAMLAKRLSRSGLAVSGAALAAVLSQQAASAGVPLSVVFTTIKAAGFFAAGQAATSGVLSARAVALTDGVLKTMLIAKLKIATFAVLALGLLAGGVGVVALRTEAARAAAAFVPVEPPDARRPATAEKDGIVFELVLPDRAWTVPEDKPGNKSPVTFGLRVTNKTEKPLRFSTFDTRFPEMTGPDGKALHLEWERRRSRAPTEADCPLIGPGKSVTLPIDAALSWQSGAIRFGGGDGFGGWWHFDGLRPGRYRLRVAYRNKDASVRLPGKEELLEGIWTGEVATPFADVSLREREGKNLKERGAAIEKNGAAFELLVPEERWTIPERGKITRVELGLRITNTSTKPRRFGRFGTMVPEMVGPSAKPLEHGEESAEIAGPRVFDYPLVLPGESVTFSLDAEILWQGRGPQFSAGADRYGAYWHFDDLHPGRYKVRIAYASTDASVVVKPKGERVQDIWTGKIETPFVEVTLADQAAAVDATKTGLVESKAVEIKGLKFVALVEERVAPPPKDGERDFEIGLRVTNVTDKPLALRTFDVVRPRLYFVSGKRVVPLDMECGRNGTPKPTPPAVLQPGASWTWRPGARLGWTKDGTALRLHGPDGRGVAGVWWFTLSQGRHRLTIEHANTNAKQDDVGLWVGTATTDEATFEVGPLTAAMADKGVGCLIADLDSDDGNVRVAATKEVLRRGRDLLPVLEKAAAGQGGADGKRVHVVWLLVKGLPPPGGPGGPTYKPGTFGIRFEKGTTRENADRLGKKLGFTVGDHFSEDGQPNCYVNLDKGKSLPDVLREVLTTEPRVIAVNLNWIEY